MSKRSDTGIVRKFKAFIEQVRQAFGGTFVRNVATVVSGTAGAQLISAGFSPFLTRIYGPEAFGVLGSFMALVAILSHVAGATYPIAIVLPDTDSEAEDIAKLSLLVSITVALILAPVILGAQMYAKEWVDLPHANAFAILLPISMVLITAVSISRQWLIRKRLFSITAKALVAQSTATNLTKLIAGYFAPVPMALVGVATAGPGLHVALMWSGTKDLLKSIFRPQDSVRQQLLRLRKLAWKYRDFPIYRAPQALLYSFGSGFPTIFLATSFGASAAGFYAISQIAMGLPAALIGKSVGDVFYPKITGIIQDGLSPRRMITKATWALGAISVVPFSIAAIFGPAIFQLIFGSEWMVAGEYARWLSVFFFMNLVNKPTLAAIPSLGLQGQLLLYEVISTAAKLSALLIGFYHFKSDLAAVALFSIVGAITYALLILYVLAKSKEVNQQ